MSKEDPKHVVEKTTTEAGRVGGTIEMSTNVVATVAALAARDIPGIHSLGKSRLIPFGGGASRGVAAEVGKEEAAIDVEVIIEHGADIRELGAELRQRIATEVDKMTGRRVVEVNIDIVDVHVPGEEPKKLPEESRVR
jgi:uncharacterized alkaline shock family protein YloU